MMANAIAVFALALSERNAGTPDVIGPVRTLHGRASGWRRECSGDRIDRPRPSTVPQLAWTRDCFTRGSARWPRRQRRASTCPVNFSGPAWIEPSKSSGPAARPAGWTGHAAARDRCRILPAPDGGSKVLPGKSVSDRPAEPPADIDRLCFTKVAPDDQGTPARPAHRQPFALCDRVWEAGTTRMWVHGRFRIHRIAADLKERPLVAPTVPSAASGQPQAQ